MNHTFRTLHASAHRSRGRSRGQVRPAAAVTIEEHFPPDAHYTRPLGGLFVWVELPPHIDTRELLLEAKLITAEQLELRATPHLP